MIMSDISTPETGSRTGGRSTAVSTGTFSVPFFAAAGEVGSAFLVDVDGEVGAGAFLSGVAGVAAFVSEARGGEAGGGLVYLRAAEGEGGGDLAEAGMVGDRKPSGDSSGTVDRCGKGWPTEGGQDHGSALVRHDVSLAC